MPKELTLAGVVHDLNNVFQTLIEFAELLSTDHKWSSLATSMQRSVGRGRRILASLRENAIESVELAAVVESAIEFADDTLRALRIPNVEFHREIEPGLRLSGAPEGWERVLLNLFINAGQAMKDGGRIEIFASRIGEQIEIRVADSGPGIPPEVLPNIFEPHFSTKRSGSGLGLHIVESIVRQNGGSVYAANRPGRPGAEFRIQLPVGA